MNFLDIDTAKSYATENNLIVGLTKLGLNKYKFMVVCNRSGRFTAIFSLSMNEINGGYIGLFSCHGFKTFG